MGPEPRGAADDGPRGNATERIAPGDLANSMPIAVSRVSNGEQMPSVSSSLLEDVRFSSGENSDSSARTPPWISTENGPHATPTR
jgi:hypothetical protein